MSINPLVSVLIRTKDRKALLQEALASVLGQTWPNVEVIIVNDGGEDFSAAVVTLCKESLPARSAIRWLNNDGDHGRSHAANLALSEATGEYCLLLDDDDTLDPPHLANLITALQAHPEHAAAYSAVRTVSGDVVSDTPIFGEPWDPVRLMIENYIPIHAVLFRRSLVVVTEGCRFDPAFNRYEDWDFWLQVAQQHSMLFVNECTATYRVDSASGFGAKKNLEADIARYRIALYRKWLPRWSDAGILTLIDRSRAFPRLAVQQNQINHLNKQLDQRQSNLINLEKQYKNLEKQYKNLEKQYKNLEKQYKKLTEQYQEKDAQAEAEIAARHRIEITLVETQNEVAFYRTVSKSMREELDIVYQSRSWKLTRPLRALTRLRWHWQRQGFRGIIGRLTIKLAERRNRFLEMKQELPIARKYTPLAFPTYTSPKFSIVIPVYNQHLYTFHCLKSILTHLGEDAVEIIVVDDQSTDKTQKMLAGIRGITVIRNEKNAGFIRSCNAGAAAASGEFLVLLNNDTEVKEDWLGAMCRTFSDFPDSGMVGARLVYANGTLQEAGGLVWQDGSAWNFGRNDDPNKPEYAYCRRADYCSGACLMIRRTDFNTLGGFDEHYLPAYYEDTDLAFRVRQSGKQVYYQPAATIIHFEGITSGTDTQGGIKRYQEVNFGKFFERWRDVLAHHRPNGELPLLEKERHVNRRILVIDARVLMPDHDSGSLRMFNILRILQRLDYKVTFLPANRHFHESYTPQMQALGIECQYAPYVDSVRGYLEKFGAHFDAVILSRADYAEKYIDDVKACCPQAKVLFDTVDLHFLREEREAELTGDPAARESAALRKSQELGVARKADATLVVSPVELDLFRLEAPDVDVRLLSNVHETHETKGSFAERRDMLFIGNFEHPPNTDSMLYFLDDIFPRVLAKNPTLRLHVVGRHVPGNLKARASENVIFSGFVSDIAPMFDSIRLSIAPLRYGAGVKGKINSSLSYGVPMVVTSIAAEGMGLVHGKDILVADSPEDFAGEILRLYEDEKLWIALSSAGKENIESHFSFALAERQLREILPA